MPFHQLLLNALSIVLIDLLLAGDNALVIAMAVRSLPRRERRIGSIGGALAAVILRVALTTVAARLLSYPYLQLAGGLLILWIAFKVLVDAGDPPDATPSPRRFWEAIWYIMVADITMSTDNILAIAGASRGHVGLIVFGLGLSIPFVVFSANLIADLMDRYPAIIYVGSGILGKVAGDMIATDAAVIRALHPSYAARYAADAVLIAVVLIAGGLVARRRRKARATGPA